jgi:hypothetical protein
LPLNFNSCQNRKLVGTCTSRLELQNQAPGSWYFIVKTPESGRLDIVLYISGIEPVQKVVNLHANPRLPPEDFNLPAYAQIDRHKIRETPTAVRDADIIPVRVNYRIRKALADFENGRGNPAFPDRHHTSPDESMGNIHRGQRELIWPDERVSKIPEKQIIGIQIRL